MNEQQVDLLKRADRLTRKVTNRKLERILNEDDEIRRLTLRVPGPLYEKIRAEAQKKGLSVNDWIEDAFERTVAGSMTIKFRHTDVDGVWDVVLGGEVIGKIENLSKTSTARFGFLYTRFEDDLVRQCDYFANLKRWIEVSIKQGDEIADQFRW